MGLWLIDAGFPKGEKRRQEKTWQSKREPSDRSVGGRGRRNDVIRKRPIGWISLVVGVSSRTRWVGLPLVVLVVVTFAFAG